MFIYISGIHSRNPEIVSLLPTAYGVWGQVMFSQVVVCSLGYPSWAPSWEGSPSWAPSWEGVSFQLLHGGLPLTPPDQKPTPKPDTHPPTDQTPTHPQTRYPSTPQTRPDTHPPTPQTRHPLPPSEMATAAVGTHPTGMPSCFIVVIGKEIKDSNGCLLWHSNTIQKVQMLQFRKQKQYDNISISSVIWPLNLVFDKAYVNKFSFLKFHSGSMWKRYSRKRLQFTAGKTVWHFRESECLICMSKAAYNLSPH